MFIEASPSQSERGKSKYFKDVAKAKILPNVN
jgi:hypothetical protein